MKILLFDITITGHHSEYINNIVKYISDNNLSDEFVFVVHYEFSNQFPEIIKIINSTKNICIVEVTKYEYNWAIKGNIITRSLRTYKLMNNFAQQFLAQKVFLLYFNTFQLALSIYRPNFLISGILFMQFYRIERNSLKKTFKYLRKYIQTWLFSLNKNINHIFILNDTKTVDFLNKEFKTNIFKMLPDPVPVLNTIPGFIIRDYFKIHPKKKIFLHPGSLIERKGTIEILNAFYHLRLNVIEKITVILIGKAGHKTDAIIKNKISKIEKTYPSAQIIYRNEFVSNAMLKTCFDQCDFVLLPYKNPESSSGILGHAIAANKCVIGTNSGLLGYLIKIYAAGLLIDEATAHKIAEKMEIALNNHFSNNNSTQFIENHSPSMFAKILLT